MRFRHRIGLCLFLSVICTLSDIAAHNHQQGTSGRDKLQHPDLQPGGLLRPGMPLGPAGFIVLVPVDDRPAVAQFAQMIGAIADHRVVMPPPEILGRFTTPGNTAQIEQWLRAQNYSRVDALVVSVDMLAYGGLIASRVPNVSEKEARKRLEFFRWFKRTHPHIPIYAFNVLMRVAPTASATSRAWREPLTRWAELKDRVPQTKDPAEKAALAAELTGLEKALDPKLIADYRRAHKRDLAINLAMVDLVKEGAVDSLLLLQDDARLYGLHRQSQEVLRAKLKADRLEHLVPIYNGTDEGSLSLISRAILDKFRSKIKVAVIYSAERSRRVIAPFEDHPLEFTLASQIAAAGGVLSDPAEADYTLYVNAPETGEQEFADFLKGMIADLKAGNPVALADILFPAPHYSGADERIIRALLHEGLVDRLTAYAGWNTAGNTLGTTIPAANMRMLFRKALYDTPERFARATVAQLEFLLHRFVGDYLYHDIVRPEINRELRRNPQDPTDEFTPDLYTRVNRQVEERLRPLTEKFFAEHFKEHTYPLAIYEGRQRTVRINALNNLKIHLPWPRTFEAAIDYRFAYTILP